MAWLPVVYFSYMFVSFYFLLLTLLLYFQNRKELFNSPKKTKNYSLTVLVPILNEEDTIQDTIEHIFRSGYNGLKEVIAINDGSSDGTLEILKKLKKKYSKLRILNKKNSGKADSVNRAFKLVRTELVAIVDADSYPSEGSLDKMVGYFDDPGVGVVTCTAIPRNTKGFWEKMQAIEYRVIALTRKLLDFVDSIYVAPGSLSIYRMKAIRDIGGYDVKNITEDIEATWHLLHNGWKVKMCLNAYVTTTTPHRFGSWYKQRRRWGVGGLQVLFKYYKDFMKGKNMLGYFIIPFFALGLILGLVGFGIFVYVYGRRLIREYLIAKYSVDVGIPILALNDFYLNPSILNYFGLILFGLFFIFTMYVLAVMKDNYLEKQGFFNILFYMTIYLLTYPIIRLVAIWHFIRGKAIWR